MRVEKTRPGGLSRIEAGLEIRAEGGGAHPAEVAQREGREIAMDAAEIEVKQVGDFLLAVLCEIECAGFLGKSFLEGERGEGVTDQGLLFRRGIAERFVAGSLSPGPQARDEIGARGEGEERSEVDGDGMREKLMCEQFGDRGIEIDFLIPQMIPVEEPAAPVRDPDIQTTGTFGEGAIACEEVAVAVLESVIVAGRDKGQHLLEMIEVVACGEFGGKRFAQTE